MAVGQGPDNIQSRWGDEPAYRRHRSALLDRFGGADIPWYEVERIAVACLLRPADPEELGRIVALVDRVEAVGRRPPHPDHGYIEFAKGFAEHRRGRHREAMPLLVQSASVLTNRPGPRLVLAMAQSRAGSAAEARDSLLAAVGSYDWKETQADQPTIWASHALLREAEGLILPELPAFLDETYRPRDDAERRAFLELCLLTDRFRCRAVARLLEETFAADPRLAEDLAAGHLTNAARAAALGCGRVSSVGESERARWRALAWEWMRAELAAWGRTLEADPAAIVTAQGDGRPGNPPRGRACGLPGPLGGGRVRARPLSALTRIRRSSDFQVAPGRGERVCPLASPLPEEGPLGGRRPAHTEWERIDALLRAATLPGDGPAAHVRSDVRKMGEEREIILTNSIDMAIVWLCGQKTRTAATPGVGRRLRRGWSQVSPGPPSPRCDQIMSSSQKSAAQKPAVDPIGPSSSGLERVRRALEGISYGEVRVVIQDGVIVQIERLEKHRLR